MSKINDSLIVASKAMQVAGGNLPFPSYGSGYGASRIWESEAQWDAWTDLQYGDGAINIQKYRQKLGDLSRNSLMCAAIRLLGDSFLEAPIQVKEKKGGKSGKKGESKIIADHKLPALWNRPNNFYDGTVLKKGIAFSLVLASNAYVIKNFSQNGLWPLELWWEPHWTCRPMFPMNGSAFISHYEVNRNGMWYQVPIENVIHIRDGIHPYNQRLGFSGNDSISPELFADAEAAGYYASLLGGSGVPQFMVGIDKGMKLDQKKAEQMEKMIVRKTTGDRKGQPFVIGGGRAYKLGINPKDLDMSAARYAAEDRFCAVKGIPAVVLELGSGMNKSIYSNVKMAMERVWRSFICPKLTMMEGQLDVSLLEDFEDVTPGQPNNRYCEHDLSQIQALQEDQTELATRLENLYSKGAIMRSELRSGLNYGPSIEGDEDVDKVYFIPKGGSLVKPNEEPLAQGEQIIDMTTGEIRAGAPPPTPEAPPAGLLGPGQENAPDGQGAPANPLLAITKAMVGDGLKGGPGSGRHADSKTDPSKANSYMVRRLDSHLVKMGFNFDKEGKVGDYHVFQYSKSDGAKAHLYSATGDIKIRSVDGRVTKVKYEQHDWDQSPSKSLELSQAIQDLLPDGFLNPQAGWVNFPAKMNSLNIPRTSMPQVMSNHRGAMVQFLRGRGITHSNEDVLPGDLSPTQAEYRPDKVESAKEWDGPQRPILVSADNRVVDGHHQWMAAMASPEEKIPVIRLDSPILPLLLEVARFPSSGVRGEDDELQFWGSEKAMPSKGSLVTSKDVSETISFLKRNRYQQAAAMLTADKMVIPKASKKSNGDSELLST